MNNPKHTPGPWRWHCTDIFPAGNPDFKRWHLFSASSRNADMVLAPNGEPQKFELVVSEADADLIYRAWQIPELEARIKELREALERIKKELNVSQSVSGIVMCCQFGRIQEIACEALAKVRKD